MRLLQLLALLASTLSVGLMAGLFTGFSYAVMPGLRILDDRGWIAGMQHINKVILNGWFMTAFLGSVLFTAAALALNWCSGDRAASPWILLALALALVMFIGTVAVNVPMNDRLEAAGDPASITDPAALRASIESRWIAWNTVRGVASLLSFLALAWALVVHGRNPLASTENGATAPVAPFPVAPLNSRYCRSGPSRRSPRTGEGGSRPGRRATARTGSRRSRRRSRPGAARRPGCGGPG